MGKDGRADKQRRPKGTLWHVTPDIVERLEKLIKGGVEQKEIAVRLSRRMGYKVDPSSVSNVLRVVHPTSVLPGPMAVEFGWPMPPAAMDDERLAKIVSMYAEIMLLDPERTGDVDEFAAAELANARRFHKSSRGTPEKP